MIVPMKKVSLVVLEKEREAALRNLRSLAVVHVEKKQGTSVSLNDLQAVKNRLDQAIALLEEFSDSKAEHAPQFDSKEKVLSVVDTVLQMREEKRIAQESISRIERELDRLQLWGAIDPADFELLTQKGLKLLPFEMTSSEYATIPDSVKTIVVNRDKKNVRCIVVSENDFIIDDFPVGAKQLVLPQIGTERLKKELQSYTDQLPKIELLFMELSISLSILKSFKKTLEAEIQFESIQCAMPSVLLSDEKSILGKTEIVWLEGFLPTSEVSSFSAFGNRNSWAFSITEPSEEDAVPTLLKNNRFVNLISPLMDFLGTVPGYRELDISLWFLLFFGVFFAMIFGDGGYGALLVIIAAWNIFSFTKKKQKAPTGLHMLLYLGLMTVAWGTITCSWFGMPTNMLPSFLVSLSIPSLSNANPNAELVKQNIQVLCFTLGLVQISLAHIIGFLRYRKSLKALGELGALAMTIGMYFVVLSLVVSAEKFPMNNLVLGLVGGGFLVNFLFINYSGSIGGGILESLKNIITMCLGIVNMFGDIMSYIRLWAVGLAGSAISQTINEMAGPFLGGFVIFAAILILFFGHGLNYVMSVLSVIVHGVRLNTLEFSNHLGLTWSGFKYEPFSETVSK